MFQTTLQSAFTGLAGVALAFGGIAAASAQLPNCQAPRSSEFLLLVVTRTPEAQARIRSVVSRTADLSVCNYFGETVTRVGGYRDADSAKSWADYLNDTVRLRAFVAVPPGSAQVANRTDLPPAQARSAPVTPSAGQVANPIDLPPAQVQPGRVQPQSNLSYTTAPAQGYNPQRRDALR